MTDTSAMDRRLRVVLFADIVGFTALSSTDEGAAIAVAETLRSLAATHVERGEGRVVKHLGDGILAVFDGARHGVTAALTLVDAFPDATADVAGGPHQLRLGLHMGEISETGSGDVFGDAVNRASRIQSEAEPGDVFVSDAMAGLLRQDHRFEFEDRGARMLKGIEGAAQVYRVTAAGATSKPVSVDPRNAHPLADARVRRWAYTMGTVVAVGAFSFLIIGTGALPGGRDAGGEAAGPEAPVEGGEEANEAGREAGLEAGPDGRGGDPAAGDHETPVDAGPGPSETQGAGPGSSDEGGAPTIDDPPSGPGTAEPFTRAELERFRTSLWTDPGTVADLMGQRAPVSWEEEEVRLSALILAGRLGVARRRLSEAQGGNASFDVPSVALALMYFRAADYDGARRILVGDAGVNPEGVEAAVLAARVAAATGRGDGAVRMLERVPQGARTAVWREWRAYFGQVSGGEGVGLGVIRSLTSGGDGSAIQYVRALTAREIGRDEVSSLIVERGRRSQWEDFLWVDVEPEWSR